MPAPKQGLHTPQSLRASIAALRLPFGLPFGREHFVVPELRSPTRSLSPNLGEQFFPSRSEKYCSMLSRLFLVIYSAAPDGAMPRNGKCRKQGVRFASPLPKPCPPLTGLIC